MRCNVKHFAAAKQPGSLTLSEMVERRNLEANPGGCNNQKVAAKRPTLNCSLTWWEISLLVQATSSLEHSNGRIAPRHSSCWQKMILSRCGARECWYYSIIWQERLLVRIN